MHGTTEWIEGQLKIPDLLRAVPQVRPVLDHYGLKGCGGPLGPAESLAFFAQAHEVTLPRLLEELREAARPTSQPIPLPLADAPSRADTIYRPFFKAGIVVTLTLGAVWGAYLLLRIAVSGSFTTAGLHEVNAHGHAQIFGWVGLFVMGFAYQAFPRFKHTTLSHPNLSTYPVAEGVLTASDRVGAVLDRYPVLLKTFLAFGFRPLSNPLLRRMMARHITLAAACRHMGVDLEAFLAALNDARARHAASLAATTHCCDSCAKEEHHV